MRTHRPERIAVTAHTFCRPDRRESHPRAADNLGLPEGCPVFASLVDTSAAMLATDYRPGRLVHSAGSTDVLALCLEKAAPAVDILTRPLGTGHKLPKRWLAVSTIAAGGSTMHWLKDNLFADYSTKRFHKLTQRLGQEMRGHKINTHSATDVSFTPIFGGRPHRHGRTHRIL